MAVVQIEPTRERGRAAKHSSGSGFSSPQAAYSGEVAGLFSPWRTNTLTVRLTVRSPSARFFGTVRGLSSPRHTHQLTAAQLGQCD